jgi:hypothetical protein
MHVFIVCVRNFGVFSNECVSFGPDSMPISFDSSQCRQLSADFPLIFALFSLISLL